MNNCTTMGGELFRIANKNANDISDAEVQTALSFMEADARVSSVEYVGRILHGRPAFSIYAVGTGEGTLVGTVSIGRALHALGETPEERAVRRERENAEIDAYLKISEQEHRLERMKAETAAAFNTVKPGEREDNLARLKAAGINPYNLVKVVNGLASGRYMDPADRAFEDFDWYCREIVRGRSKPMALGRYLAGFTPTH